MAFLESFGGFGQSQMLTRVRQSITIQNSKIANLQSRINNLISFRNFSKMIYPQRVETEKRASPEGGMF